MLWNDCYVILEFLRHLIRSMLDTVFVVVLSLLVSSWEYLLRSFKLVIFGQMTAL